jgi:hypothetical protein
VDTDSRRGSVRLPRRLEAAMLFLSVAVPLVCAASQVSPFADASHDEAIVRGLGLNWTGAWRALDVPVSSLLLFLPFGTRALRVGLVSAALGGIGGGLLYSLARRVLPEDRSFGALVATLASLCASLSGTWLLESSSAGSCLLGVVLALAPVALLGSRRPERAKWPLLAGGLAAALTYEPLVGLIACAGSIACVALGEAAPPTVTPPPRTEKWGTYGTASLGAKIALGVIAGCLPFAIAVACRHLCSYRLEGGFFRAWAGEGASFGDRSPAALAVGELGGLLVALSLVGAVQVFADRQKRAVGGAMVAIVFASVLALLLAPPSGSEHFRAPALTLVGALAVLAVVPMGSVLTAVRHAKIPLASTSAAMVLLLELTFPVLTLDETLQRLGARAPARTRAWEDGAFESLPAGALMLASDRELYARALASLATGELRADLTFIPTFDTASDAAQEELSRDPNLYPLWRDLVLHGSPRERSLSSVAASRPLVLEFEPSWDRGLARHLVPTGLLASFRPEPRGASERLLALDGSSSPLAPPGDGALAELTARLLDARAATLSSLGEREAAARVDGESTGLSLPTSTGERRPRRLVTARGSRIVTSL